LKSKSKDSFGSSDKDIPDIEESVNRTVIYAHKNFQNLKMIDMNY
jgi:hypothetical protein